MCYLKDELYSEIGKSPVIFDFLQNGSLDGLWYWDIEKPENEWMNDRFWTLLGYDPVEKEPLSKEWQDLIFPEDLEVALENFRLHCADSSHPYDQIVRYKHKSGSTVWVRCRGLLIRDETGKPIRMLGAHTDITKLKELELELLANIEELKTLTVTDQLTKLSNRRGFQNHLEWILNQRNTTFSLALIDIDHFKKVNDTYGHKEGDRILAEVAAIIRDVARKEDFCARWGGEEFALLMNNVDESVAMLICNRIREAVEKRSTVTVSIGVNTCTTDVEKLDTVVSDADKALYASKHSGRNKVVCNTCSMSVTQAFNQFQLQG